jgi:hypothetical protein
MVEYSIAYLHQIVPVYSNISQSKGKSNGPIMRGQFSRDACLASPNFFPRKTCAHSTSLDSITGTDRRYEVSFSCAVKLPCSFWLDQDRSFSAPGFPEFAMRLHGRFAAFRCRAGLSVDPEAVGAAPQCFCYGLCSVSISVINGYRLVLRFQQP